MPDKTTDPREAIETAIKREREAHKFCAGHAELFDNDATRQMFLFPAEEEKKHEQKLQEELDNNYLTEMQVEII